MSEQRTQPEPGAGTRPLAAIILAAGRGRRMNSERPKVVHEVAGRPMVWWVVKAVREAGARPIVVVIGHGADAVRQVFAGESDIELAVQGELLGTAHATACAEAVLGEFYGDVLVVAGDGPLIRTATIEAMLERHRAHGAAATLATAVIEDPEGYGRVVRDADGRFEAIVEHRHATNGQRAIREIYPSYACFDAASLFDALRRLEPNADSGEYYITEVPALLKTQGHRVEIVDAVPPEDVLSINTPDQLAEVDAILSARLESHP